MKILTVGERKSGRIHFLHMIVLVFTLMIATIAIAACPDGKPYRTSLLIERYATELMEEAQRAEGAQQAEEALRAEGARRAEEALRAKVELLAREKQKRLDAAKEGFITHVQQMDTEYMHEEYYGIDAAMAHNFQMPTIDEHAHQELMSFDTLDAETIYALIAHNNEQYKLKSRPKTIWSGPRAYYDVDEALLRKFAAIVCEVMNDALASDPRIDRASLLCRIANLKILFDDDPYINGVARQDGSIVLNPQNIDNVIQNFYEGRDMYEYYFRHELEHVFHMFCEDEREDGLVKGGVGICFENDRLNPLFWQWFFEGSAEKVAMNAMHSESSSYLFNVAYIDSMTLSFLADSNVSCTTLEKIHRPRELELFFELFSNLERNEVIKMMYALDLVLMQPYELETICELANDELPRYEQTKAFNANLKADVLESMSKNMYLNLLYRSSAGDAELNDILHIIKIWEFDVNSHIAYYAEENVPVNGDFMKKYSEMQTVFFQYLCEKFNKTLPELEQLLLEYDPRVPREISWLDEEKNRFLVTLAESNQEDTTKDSGEMYKPIRVYNDILMQRHAESAA